MKYNYGWNMGPRGPMHGYGRPMRRRSFGGGLMGLLGLIIALRVILPLIGLAAVTAGAVFAGLAAAFSGILSEFACVFFSGTAATAGGVAIGVAIGLIVYRMIRNRKEEERRIREEETAEEVVRSEFPADPEENTFTGTESVRSYYA